MDVLQYVLVGKELSQWVNKNRERKGWSMRELARRSGLSPTQVSQVINGKEEPGAKFYQGMARAFGVTLESVEQLDKIGEVPQSRLDHPTFKQLMEVAQRLTLDDLQEVLDYALHRLRKSHDLPPD